MYDALKTKSVPITTDTMYHTTKFTVIDMN